MESFTKTLPRVDPEVCQVADEMQAEAIRIFRVVKGPGDCGSQTEFFAQSTPMQLGWSILAAEILKLKKAVAAKKKSKPDEPNIPSS